jgi:hypothetical protein
MAARIFPVIRAHVAAHVMVAAGAALALVSMPAIGQTAAKSSTAIPRLPDGKPDMSGVWQRPFVEDMTKDGPNQKGMRELPFTPAGLADWKAYSAAKYDYTAHCLPLGLTRSMNSPFPIQLIHTPAQLAILVEMNNTFHIVPLDGRKHPTDLGPLWNGLSTGHWDGDTLVVETTGFNDKSRLDTIGHPHSDALHVTQRFTRADGTHMAYEVIIDDPKTYTSTWKNTRTFTLRPDWEIMEYSCEENNKDVNEGHIK